MDKIPWPTVHPTPYDDLIFFYFSSRFWLINCPLDIQKQSAVKPNKMKLQFYIASIVKKVSSEIIGLFVSRDILDLW